MELASSAGEPKNRGTVAIACELAVQGGLEQRFSSRHMRARTRSTERTVLGPAVSSAAMVDVQAAVETR